MKFFLLASFLFFLILMLTFLKSGISFGGRNVIGANLVFFQMAVWLYPAPFIDLVFFCPLIFSMLSFTHLSVWVHWSVNHLYASTVHVYFSFVCFALIKTSPPSLLFFFRMFLAFQKHQFLNMGVKTSTWQYLLSFM